MYKFVEKVSSFDCYWNFIGILSKFLYFLDLLNVFAYIYHFTYPCIYQVGSVYLLISLAFCSSRKVDLVNLARLDEN